MGFSGLIKCPDCDSPIGADVSVCPYCSSMAPASAPWKNNTVLGWITIAAVIGGIWALNHFYGIDVNEWFQVTEIKL